MSEINIYGIFSKTSIRQEVYYITLMDEKEISHKFKKYGERLLIEKVDKVSDKKPKICPELEINARMGTELTVEEIKEKLLIYLLSGIK